MSMREDWISSIVGLSSASLASISNLSIALLWMSTISALEV